MIDIPTAEEMNLLSASVVDQIVKKYESKFIEYTSSCIQSEAKEGCMIASIDYSGIIIENDYGTVPSRLACRKLIFNIIDILKSKGYEAKIGSMLSYDGPYLTVSW